MKAGRLRCPKCSHLASTIVDGRCEKCGYTAKDVDDYEAAEVDSEGYMCPECHIEVEDSTENWTFDGATDTEGRHQLLCPQCHLMLRWGIPHHGHCEPETKPELVDIGTDYCEIRCRLCGGSMQVMKLWVDTTHASRDWRRRGCRIVLGVRCPECGYCDALKPHGSRVNKVENFGRENWTPR